MPPWNTTFITIVVTLLLWLKCCAMLSFNLDSIHHPNAEPQKSSSMNLAEYGEWHSLPECPNGGNAVYMRIVEVPFILELDSVKKLYHHSLEFRVICHGEFGTETKFSIDFGGMRTYMTQAYGYYGKQMGTINETAINLELAIIKELSKTAKTYNAFTYNCQHFSRETFETILLEDQRRKNATTTETPTTTVPTTTPKQNLICKPTDSIKSFVSKINCPPSDERKISSRKACYGRQLLSNLYCSTDSSASCNVSALPIRNDPNYCRMVHVYFDCLIGKENDPVGLINENECTRAEYDAYYCFGRSMFDFCFKNGAFQLKLSLVWYIFVLSTITLIM